ncbi:hypothetical protein AVEN_213301-1 [Araneus ventricosus]|uniref:Uncharacterized protein n=1 Tax=Araneus ventricosus TaxID=182803 RepID=A0A4Y2DF52_ARAVE|nr:hypothetical protein AVEN_80641-1 [Araneus ventricosus]GBM14896.1 hypothetical protein AVEN_213301-1 [Araneus ventricosus]
MYRLPSSEAPNWNRRMKCWNLISLEFQLPELLCYFPSVFKTDDCFFLPLFPKFQFGLDVNGLLNLPLSGGSSSQKQAVLQKCRPIHELLPDPSLKHHKWSRFEIMCFSERGPFKTYLLSFHLRSTDSCSCGEAGSPIHFATSCPLTSPWHFSTSMKSQFITLETSGSSLP